MSSSASDLWHAYTRDIVPLTRRSVAASSPALPRRRPAMIGHTLDLHGLPLAEAHARTVAFLSDARRYYHSVTVVTGRSGAIRREFLDWLDRSMIPRVEPLNGNGGFRCYYRK